MGVSTISLGLGLGGGKAATSSGRSGGGGGGFNIDLRDTHSNIIARSGDAVGTIAFATDTYDLYVFDGSNWYFYDYNSTTAFASTLSASFDGTDDYLAVGSSYDLGTLSLWFKSDATITKSSSTKALVGFTGVSTYAVYASIQTGGNVTGAVTDELITLYTGDWAYSYSSSSGSINTDWHHLAVRWTGSDYEIYLDGTQVKNDDGQVVGDQSKAKIPISSFDVGIRNGSDRAFDGLIDEVAIWSTPLSASATADLYNSGVPSDLTSLSPNGWWRMGENDSGSNGATIGTVTDQGSGGNNGTGTNGPTYSSTTP